MLVLNGPPGRMSGRRPSGLAIGLLARAACLATLLFTLRGWWVVDAGGGTPIEVRDTRVAERPARRSTLRAEDSRYPYNTPGVARRRALWRPWIAPRKRIVVVHRFSPVKRPVTARFWASRPQESVWSAVEDASRIPRLNALISPTGHFHRRDGSVTGRLTRFERVVPLLIGAPSKPWDARNVQNFLGIRPFSR